MQNQNEYTKPKKKTYNSKNQRAKFDMLNKEIYK